MDLNRMQQLAGIIPTRSGLSESSQVGKTILQQMGGLGRITAMLGAKNIVLSDNGVSFRWPNKERAKGNAVRITLDPSDTYTMEFLNVSGSSAKTVKKYTDVYNDQLVDIFEKQTGWYLSLGGGRKSGSGKKPGPEVDPSNTTASTTTSASGKFWTVSSMDGTFDSLDAAKKAWFAAGKPKAHGNSVWASEHHGEKTLRTVTLNPSMEAKLDELRSLLGEKIEDDEDEKDDCYCKDGDDCDCNDEGDRVKEAREFSFEQIETILMGEDTPDLVRHCVRGVAKKYDGDVQRGFAICTAQLQKAGYLKPDSMELTAAGKAKEKEHDADPDAAKKFGDYEKMLKKARKEEVEEDDCGCGTPDPMEALLRDVRDIVEAEKKTHAQGQKDALDALEKRGWKVARGLKIPHATHPEGDVRLWFKPQAVHFTHAKAEYPYHAGHSAGNMRQLHPDIDLRKHSGDTVADYAEKHFKAKSTKAAPAKEPEKQLNPDQYHQKHGQCPEGYHFDDATKRCEKTKSEGSAKQCPECMEDMKYDDSKDAWVCGECGYVGPSGPATKGVTETLRLAGINRYAENVAPRSSKPISMSMTGLVSEIRKYATGSLHPDWKVATDEAYAAPMTGAPGGDEDVDVWNPSDTGSHIAGRPDTKAAAPAKKPADKNAALLKALKCPPGKEAKVVYGKPSCVPAAKA